MSLETFASIYDRAAKRKGGAAALESLLAKPKTPSQLKRIGDDRYLSEMTACVFRAGFVWKIIEAKWAGFEEAFAGFDTMTCALLSDEDLEKLAMDARIVRNAKKIASVRDNAQFVRAVAEENGSFGRYLADWPVDDIVGLWDALKSRGSRLGGATSGFFLRFVGKDTFMLSADVVKALIRQRVIEKSPTSKKSLAAVQRAFNEWRGQSDRPLCQISRVLSCSVE